MEQKIPPAIFTAGKFCAMSLAKQLQHLLINTPVD
jgi:hypothetical protein